LFRNSGGAWEVILRAVTITDSVIAPSFGVRQVNVTTNMVRDGKGVSTGIQSYWY
jgi:hypothetical protein